MRLARLLTLVRKELALLGRDPQSRRLLVLPVLLQLAVFPFAASLEVKNSRLAILDEDTGAEATELAQRLAKTAAFPTVLLLHGDDAVTSTIDRQDALLVLRIPPTFSRDVAAGRAARIQALIDGRRSNSAQIALGYAEQVVNDWTVERASAAGRSAPAAIAVRYAYNPNLEYRWFILPSLVAIITTLGSLIVTALSVAREREQGTLEQLLVSPLTPALIIVGKVLPAMLVATAQASIVALAAVAVYRVPFAGPVAALYAGLVCYSLALAGFGIFISSLCATQQQAFLGVFTFMVPAVMLSGFIGPVENMPPVLQWVSLADPLRHFIPVVKGVFLKGVDAATLARGLWPLLAIAGVTLSAGYAMFVRRASQ